LPFLLQMRMHNLISIVDDDRGFLRAIARVLKIQGFDVRTFRSAEDFLGRTDPSEPACLILDINLGGISGIELLHQLSRSGISVPVVFVTANDNENIRKAAVTAGCVAYLEKPVEMKALMEAVGEALRPDRCSFG
jgi:FixJ family two-component response regulator